MKKTVSHLLFIVGLAMSVLTGCKHNPDSSLKDEQGSTNSKNIFDIKNLGLDVTGYWKKLSSSAAERVIKFLYDRPSLIQNAGLDFHPNEFIETDDGIKLQISYYLPKNYEKKETFPAVIFLNPWGSSANANQLSRLPQRLSKEGYIVLLLTARGFGESGGQANFADLRDQKDVGLAIDWLLENTKTDKENIGAIGISYGGGVSLMTLVNDERLKTTVGINAWGDMTDDGGFLDGNGVNERAGRFLVEFGDLMQCRIDEAKEIRKKMMDPDSIDDIRQWGKKRSPKFFLDELNRRRPPIFFVHTYNDSFFKPNGILSFYSQYQGPKKVSFYHGVHGTNMMFEGYADQGVGGEVISWFDRFLKNQENSLAVDAVSYSIRNKKLGQGPTSVKRPMVHYTNWQDSSFPKRAFYLQKRNNSKLLSASPGAQVSETDLKAASEPSLFDGDQDTKLILEGLFAWPVKENIERLDSKHTAVYYSEAMASTKIRSISTLDISLRAKGRKPQVMAYLFDQPKKGSAQLITQGSLTVVDFKDDIGFGKLQFHGIAYDLPEGHRLALVIDTKDWDFLALPEQDNNYSILEGGEYASKLNLSVEN